MGRLVHSSIALRHSRTKEESNQRTKSTLVALSPPVPPCSQLVAVHERDSPPKTFTKEAFTVVEGGHEMRETHFSHL